MFLDSKHGFRHPLKTSAKLRSELIILGYGSHYPCNSSTRTYGSSCGNQERMAQSELPSHVRKLPCLQLGSAGAHFPGLLSVQGKGAPTCKPLTSWQVGDDIPECHEELTCSELQGTAAEMIYQGLWFFYTLGSSAFLQNMSQRS